MLDRKLLRAIEGAKKGNIGSFNKLMQMRGKNMLYIARELMKGQKEGEDAAQEAALIIYQKINTLKNVEYFDTWMYRIVFNVCMRAKTKVDNQKVDIETANQGGSFVEERTEFLPEPFLEKETNKQELLSAIDELPKAYRMCLLLYYYEEMSYVDIAEVMNIKVQDVANILNRAKKKLRVALAPTDVVVQKQEADKSALSSSLVAAPLITQAFKAQAEEVVSKESFKGFINAVNAMTTKPSLLQSASAVLANSTVAKCVLIAPFCTAALAAGVFLASGNLYSIENPETLQPENVASSEEDSTESKPATQENTTQEAEDFEPAQQESNATIESDQSILLERFAGAGKQESEWQEVVNEISLYYHSTFLNGGYSYSVYTKDYSNTGTRLVVLERQDDSGQVLVVSLTRGKEEAVPEGQQAVALFDEKDGADHMNT